MKFSFEEWVTWWEDNLGPDWIRKRGHRADQYVMARNLDRGDYEPGNVYCATASKNALDNNTWNPRGGGAYFTGKHRPESIKKMSDQRTGANNPFFGRKHSDEARLKMQNNSRWRSDKLREKVI
jgi:hypothetical protein